MSAIELVDEHLIDSASGNNAGQAYKVTAVPPYPASGQRPGPPFPVFQLRPDEAIVYVGPTPPRGGYFSFTPFLVTRYLHSTIPKGDWLFASLGDPLNNVLIKTQGPGDPFHKNTIVIFTADRGVYQRIEQSARAAGYPAPMINQYVLPSSVLHLGVGPQNDTVQLLLRTGNFASKAEGDSYLRNDHYATVYRLTPKVAPTPDRFPQPPARQRDWRPEAGLVPGVQNGLARLQAAIVARTPRRQARPLASVRWFYDSRDVLRDDPRSPTYRKFVAGESSDTPYLRSAEHGAPTNFVLGAEDMVVAYGINHAATGLATYSNFGVYGEGTLGNCYAYLLGCNDPIWNGVAAMTSHEFAGSAEQYLPGDPMARYLYAVRIVRGRCPANDRYCVVVPTPSTPGSADGIDLGSPAMLGYQAYLNPVTPRRPLLPRHHPRPRDLVPHP